MSHVQEDTSAFVQMLLANPSAALSSSIVPYASTRRSAFETRMPPTSDVLPPSPCLVVMLTYPQIHIECTLGDCRPISRIFHSAATTAPYCLVHRRRRSCTQRCFVERLSFDCQQRGALPPPPASFRIDALAHLVRISPCSLHDLVTEVRVLFYEGRHKGVE